MGTHASGAGRRCGAENAVEREVEHAEDEFAGSAVPELVAPAGELHVEAAAASPGLAGGHVGSSCHHETASKGEDSPALELAGLVLGSEDLKKMKVYSG